MRKITGMAILVILLWAFLSTVDDRPSLNEIQGFQIQGDKIVAEIEHYKNASQEYPEPDVVQLPKTPFGGWVYRRSTDGSYSLWLGDYGKDGFTLSWSQKEEDWYIDR